MITHQTITLTLVLSQKIKPNTIILTMGKNMKNYPSSKQAPEQHPTRTKRKPERSKQCINALREIKKYQETTGLLIRGLPFQRLVRSTAMKYNTEMRFQRAAIEALQEGSEALLVKLFELTNILASHAKRITILKRDVELAKYILNEILPSSQ